MSDGYDYEVTLQPTCGPPGQPFTVTLRIKPVWGASAIIVPFYSDGTSDKSKAASSMPDGTVTHTWVAKPVTGDGRVLTQAHDPDTKTTGTKVVAFRVTDVGVPC